MKDFKLPNGWHIQVSKRKNKKYDVFDDKNDYILSFGDTRYQQYHDKIGHYKHLDHHDKDRRKNYLARAKGIGHVDDPYSANHYSIEYLW